MLLTVPRQNRPTALLQKLPHRRNGERNVSGRRLLDHLASYELTSIRAQIARRLAQALGNCRHGNHIALLAHRQVFLKRTPFGIRIRCIKSIRRIRRIKSIRCIRCIRTCAPRTDARGTHSLNEDGAFERALWTRVLHLDRKTSWHIRSEPTCFETEKTTLLNGPSQTIQVKRSEPNGSSLT